MERQLPRFALGALVRTAMIGGFLMAGMPAPAQDGDKQQDGEDRTEQGHDDTLERAGDIAQQPARDIGIMKKEIPPILQQAVQQPYETPRRPSCQWLRQEHASLDAALGPDFGADTHDNENKAGQLAAAGGEMLVNSLIPFRGVVREISGAAAADRRRLAAMNAGLARRGYIRGMAAARGCAIQVTPSR